MPMLPEPTDAEATAIRDAAVSLIAAVRAFDPILASSLDDALGRPTRGGTPTDVVLALDTLLPGR